MKAATTHPLGRHRSFLLCVLFTTSCLSSVGWWLGALLRLVPTPVLAAAVVRVVGVAATVTAGLEGAAVCGLASVQGAVLGQALIAPVAPVLAGVSQTPGVSAVTPRFRFAVFRIW